MNYQGIEAPNQAAPEGRYKIKIEKAEAKFSKASDRPMIEVVGVIVEGPYANRKFWDYLLTDTGGGGYQSMMRLKGLIGARVKQDIPDTLIAQEILGRVVLADLVVEERKDASGNVQMIETEDGRNIPQTSNKVQAYYSVQPTANVPQVQAQPANFAQPNLQPQFQQPQYAQVPQAPQYAQSPNQGGYQGAYVPPAQGQAPQGYAQPPAVQQQHFVPQAQQAPQFIPDANLLPPQAQQVMQAAPQHMQQAPLHTQGNVSEVMPGFQPGATVQPANVQGLPQQGQVPNGGVSPWLAAQAGIAPAAGAPAEAGAGAGGKRGKKG